jgi:hypothetical protein
MEQRLTYDYLMQIFAWQLHWGHTREERLRKKWARIKNPKTSRLKKWRLRRASRNVR